MLRQSTADEHRGVAISRRIADARWGEPPGGKLMPSPTRHRSSAQKHRDRQQRTDHRVAEGRMRPGPCGFDVIVGPPLARFNDAGCTSAPSEVKVHFRSTSVAGRLCGIGSELVDQRSRAIGSGVAPVRRTPLRAHAPRAGPIAGLPWTVDSVSRSAGRGSQQAVSVHGFGSSRLLRCLAAGRLPRSGMPSLRGACRSRRRRRVRGLRPCREAGQRQHDAQCHTQHRMSSSSAPPGGS